MARSYRGGSAKRAASGEGHPGHLDETNYDELSSVLMRGYSDPLNVGGTLYTYDTTDFVTADYSGMLNAIRMCLLEGRQ